MHLKFLTRWIKHFTSQEVGERGAFAGCILGKCNCYNLAHLNVPVTALKIRVNCENFKDSELNIPGYTLVRLDRTGKRGGGTTIYVRNNIPYKHIDQICRLKTSSHPRLK